MAEANHPLMGMGKNPDQATHMVIISCLQEQLRNQDLYTTFVPMSGHNDCLETALLTLYT